MIILVSLHAFGILEVGIAERDRVVEGMKEFFRPGDFIVDFHGSAPVNSNHQNVRYAIIYKDVHASNEQLAKLKRLLEKEGYKKIAFVEKSMF